MTSYKRSRDDDDYKSRETSRRKDDRRDERRDDRRYERRDDRNDLKHDKYAERSNGRHQIDKYTNIRSKDDRLSKDEKYSRDDKYSKDRKYSMHDKHSRDDEYSRHDKYPREDKHLKEDKNSKNDKYTNDRHSNKHYQDRPNSGHPNEKYSDNKYSNDKFQKRSHNQSNDKYSNTDQQNHHKSESVSSNQQDPPVDKPFVKEKINFNLSGKLAEDTNMHNGVIVKYSEPVEAVKPLKKWRLYPFKNDVSLDFIQIHSKSCFLLGRDRKVADIPLDHPSVSKQHAVIQFRKIDIEKEDGSQTSVIRPYLMDLESSNKTYLNNNPIDPLKYYQLLKKDVIKFGYSSREYVVLIDDEEDKIKK